MAVFQLQMFSPTLQTNTGVTVIIPTPDSSEMQQSGGMDYFCDGVKYQVLYLLHGLYGDHTNWLRYTSIERYVQDRRLAVDVLRRRMALALRSRLEGGRQALRAGQGRLPLALNARIGSKRAQLGRLTAGLDALSPLKVLGRGYAIARKGEDVVPSIARIEPGDRVDVLVSDGVLNCVVEDKEERTWR